MEKSVKIKVGFTIAFVAAVIVGFLPRKSSFGYDYKKGSVWEYETLYAQYDFPIVKTDEQIRDERAESRKNAVPYYRYYSETSHKNIKALESMRLGEVQNATVSCIRELYRKGIVSDEGVKTNEDGEVPAVIFVQRDRRAVKVPSSDVYRLSEARLALLNTISEEYPGVNVDSLFLSAGVYALLATNMMYDQQTTELVHAESDFSISPTQGVMKSGQLLVSNGEIVTAEIAQLLDSYKKEYDANYGYSASPFYMWLGNIILALVVSFLLYFAIFFTKPSIFRDSRYPYIIVVFFLTFIGSLAVIKYNEGMLLFVPFTLCAIYLQAFFKARVIIPVYIVSMLPLLLYANNGPEIFIMFLLAGLVATYSFKHLGKNWRQFVVALISFAVLTVTYAGFRITGMIHGDDIMNVFALFCSSLLAVAGYPLIYLFEKIFNLVSNSRLAELSDPSNPLLRKLEQKAPGTFQHSLQVMNMADAAARSIDANSLMVRAAALYHDIGKMNNPQCFVENESLVRKNEADKYHFDLSPIQSAHDIIKHVTDGIEIAQKNHLPSVIVSFIRTHHGTSRVEFFWSKFINAGGDPDAEAEFQYPGEKPVTKEEAVLMICDTVEAASRTLVDYSPASLEEFVDKLITAKLDEGQLSESQISVRELMSVKSAITSYLAQMHHERISYPEKNINKHIDNHESRTEKN